jgi:hypothetical protein
MVYHAVCIKSTNIYKPSIGNGLLIIFYLGAGQGVKPQIWMV